MRHYEVFNFHILVEPQVQVSTEYVIPLQMPFTLGKKCFHSTSWQFIPHAEQIYAINILQELYSYY